MKFGVIGGDRRQAELAKILLAEGYTTAAFGLEPWGLTDDWEKATTAETVILPLPLCKPDGILNCETVQMPIEEVLAKLTPAQRILAGQVKPQQLEEAKKRNLQLIDYFKREELTVANAAATAEAAIRAAMNGSDKMLLGSNCLVLGFGRIGKLLSYRLAGLGAKVTAAARKPEDLTWIKAYGWTAEDIFSLNGKVGTFDWVFNTVPNPVFGEELLRQLKPDCHCIELASVPGIDLNSAEKMGISCKWERALPGRMVPQSAARILRDTIFHILKEDT